MSAAADDSPAPIDQLSRIVGEQRASLIAGAVAEGLSAEEALECVQDALCTWLSRSAREPAAAYPAALALLKHMVRNAARNFRRRHRRLKPHRPLELDAELASSDGDAEALLTGAETSLRLHGCVAELREVERAVITLRLLEERSGEDVAQALGLSRNHVDVLVHRAKLTLRACMHAAECV
ncbi:MAG TPA: sigma-70 family RNA polymerase sigma factor [Polyangiales bacterium]|nr:sigma-70 family RNA polymerase sigma factor [Polyangiales bacterium]